MWELYFKQLSEFLNLPIEEVMKGGNANPYNPYEPSDQRYYEYENPLGHITSDLTLFHGLKDFSTLTNCIFFGVKSVLELGCGASNTAYILSHNYINVDAYTHKGKILDFQKYRSRNINNLHYYSLDEFESNNKEYDAIVCFEVLEHIKDPRITIDKLHSKLKPGHLFFTTFSSSFGKPDSHPSHLCELTNEEIFKYFISLNYKYVSGIKLPNGSTYTTSGYPFLFFKST